MKIYNDNFYLDNRTRIKSAEKLLSHLFIYFQPKSLVDVGCGRGAWLKVAQNLGVNKLLGIDGQWNKDKLILKNTKKSKVNFIYKDLNHFFKIDKKYELAICLEVAEHLKGSSAVNLVKSICNLSDTIIFSAAYNMQGGVMHINEREHSYWGQLFLKNNFFVFDIFRPYLWKKKKISFWYRQNSFLFVKKKSKIFNILTKCNIKPLSNIEFMDCIHPELFYRRVGEQGIKYYIKKIISLLIKKIKKI
jgi:SAM-dependent methyltransferase